MSKKLYARTPDAVYLRTNVVRHKNKQPRIQWVLIRDFTSDRIRSQVSK
jgi:hypothetical protein